MSEGPVIIEVLVMITVILKQSYKIGWVRNQVCLLDLGLSPWVGRSGWRHARECRILLIFQPGSLRSHVKPVVGIQAKMTLGYSSR